MWQYLNREFRLVKIFAIVCMVCLGIGIMPPMEVRADTFSNAYDFFETYGGDMIFQTGADNKGIIYYGTKGPKSSSSTRYGTVGWKVTIRDGTGNTLETLYFALGGDYLSLVDSQIINGYEYMLYSCPLPKLKGAMSQKSRNALETANCEILFDACMIVKLNDVPQGGIEDGGKTWGTVYTTYEGIVNAKNWSASSKVNLQSYFNKTVTGLFYEVKLTCGTGIESVSGAGKYCYGSVVTINAVVKDGYKFSGWTGSKNSLYESYEFTIYNQDISMTANATYHMVQVSYYRNWSEQDYTVVRKTYGYSHVATTTLRDVGWVREGYTQIGWNTNRAAVEPMYITKEPITTEWIDRYVPSVSLYVVWYPNDYVICYNSNGGTGAITSSTMDYTETLTLPSAGFSKEGSALAGWSLYEGDTYVEYACGEQVKIAELVEELNLGFDNHATITLYAIWDNPPEIHGTDLYVSLTDARNGSITEEWLGKQAYATDVEDGEIAYGKHAYNSFCVIDYSPLDFTTFQQEGYVTETFLAKDSAGNSTKLRVTIHIVDARVYEEEEVLGKVRFISHKYFKSSSGAWITEDDGGLWQDSLWRVNTEYRSILEELFMNK